MLLSIYHLHPQLMAIISEELNKQCIKKRSIQGEGQAHDMPNVTIESQANLAEIACIPVFGQRRN